MPARSCVTAGEPTGPAACEQPCSSGRRSDPPRHYPGGMFPARLRAATLIVVGLLIVVLFRMGGRFDALRAELERMRVVQRDMSSDVRARLDEGARTWESVEAEVRPRLEQLEPSVADLSAALDENLPALSEARARLEEVEGRVADTEARVVTALEAGTEEGAERFERVEAAVRTLRNAADERLADLAARVTVLESAPDAEGSESIHPEAAAFDDAPGDDAPGDDAETDGDLVTIGAAAIGAAGAHTASSRGTGRGRKKSGRRWVLVVLVLVAGLALAMAKLS